PEPGERQREAFGLEGGFQGLVVVGVVCQVASHVAQENAEFIRPARFSAMNLIPPSFSRYVVELAPVDLKTFCFGLLLEEFLDGIDFIGRGDDGDVVDVSKVPAG